MPVDNGYRPTDPFNSTFLENVNSSFSLDKISSTPQHSASVDRKRKCFEDENQDISSILAPREFLRYTYADVEPDEQTDFLQKPNENKRLTSLDIVDKTDDKQYRSLHDFCSFASEADQQINTSPRKQGTRLVDEDRAVPNDTGTRKVPNEKSSRAVTNEIRKREEFNSILKNLPSRGTMNKQDLGTIEQDSSSNASLPMKNFIESLAQQIKDRIVQDWTTVFSKMECFESAYIEQLDQILTAALAYEAKLKSEKAELRNFVAKLSDVFQHD